MTLSSLTSHVLTFRQHCDPGNPLVERAGTYEFPRTTTANSVNVGNGPWNYGLASARAHVSAGESACIAACGLLHHGDLQVQYTGFKGLKLFVFGINNVEDKAPPFSDNENDGYANSTDNPVGRYLYGRLTYTFR